MLHSLRREKVIAAILSSFISVSYATDCIIQNANWFTPIGIENDGSFIGKR